MTDPHQPPHKPWTAAAEAVGPTRHDSIPIQVSDMEATRQQLSKEAGLGVRPWEFTPLPFPAPNLLFAATARQGRLNLDLLRTPSDRQWATEVRAAAGAERTARHAAADAQQASDNYYSDGPSIAAGLAALGAIGVTTAAATGAGTLAWVSGGVAAALSLAALLTPIARRNGLAEAEQTAQRPAREGRERLERTLADRPGGRAR